MKKKNILRIVFDIVLVLSIIIFILAFISSLDIARTYYEVVKYNPNSTITIKYFAIYTASTILLIFCALFALIFFIFLNFKDISYLCGSLLKEHREKKEATAEVKKQKRIEELEKKLNELKKDE